MRIHGIALAAAVILAIAAAAAAADPNDAPASEKNVVTAANTFATDIYAQLAGKDQKNLFLSPASIHAALAMTYLGAKGPTAAEMGRTLHLGDLTSATTLAGYEALLKQLNEPPKITDWQREGRRVVRKQVPPYQLHMVNALWAQESYPFGAEYMKSVQQHFGARVEMMDFKTAPEPSSKIINEWVEKQTNDRIEDLIPQGLIDPMTRLVLTNAVYFKSNWAHKFSKYATKDKPFRLLDGKTADVPQMARQGKYGYAETEDLQVLSLPYRANQLDMIVLLPRANDGLGKLEKQLNATNLAEWTKALKTEDVRVTLPKWKFESSFTLKKTLEAMGMKLAFVWPGADFTAMSPTGELYISEAIHKAFVAVDEEGTEAAAATAVMMAAGAAPMRPKEPKVFTADHPFVFLIRHKASGVILFMGRVTNPAA